ncbi:MAG: putative 2OG-Fe(II) oxygenase [Sulfuritalea sp.]|nr:putative 2OG-Fe(II) oxygenase [Sulfuritalea sp.]
MESTTRRLRRYEAETTPCAVDAAEPPLDFFSPFGPLIARLRLPQELVDRLNAYADSRVFPDRSTEFLLPADFISEGGDESLVRHTAALVRRYLARAEGSRTERVDFDVFWVVSQYAGTPSPVHFHSGDVAGVLYLKLPVVDEAEEARTYISGRQAGYINFLIGGKQRLSKSLISFKPQVGDFYVFPGWLLHVAEPFRGRGERRSMAFNAVVHNDES